MFPKSTLITTAKAGAAALLVWALARHPYGYYTLLRWVICGVCAYSAFEALGMKKEGWLITFAILALLFNPLIPVRLDRGTWEILDLAAALALVVSLFAGRTKQ